MRYSRITHEDWSRKLSLTIPKINFFDLEFSVILWNNDKGPRVFSRVTIDVNKL